MNRCARHPAVGAKPTWDVGGWSASGGGMERARELHAEFMRLAAADPSSAAEAAALLRQSALELERPAALPAEAVLLDSLAAMDEKMAALALALASPEAEEATAISSGLDLALDPNASVVSVEEGQPPVESSTDLPTPIVVRRADMTRSLSSIGAEPFVLPARSGSNVELVDAGHEMDPALYAHATPRPLRTGSTPTASPSPSKAARLSLGSTPVPAGVAEAPEKEERIAELEAENAELKEQLTAMETYAFVAKPAASPTLQIGRGSRDTADVDNAAPKSASVPAAAKPLGKPKPRKAPKPGRMSPRPPPAADEAAAAVRMHRRGSTTGLMAVNHAPRPTRAHQRRMSLGSMLGAQGEAHVSKVEDMVALLTSVSAARDASQLVSILLHGVIELGAPDCSSCYLWVSALDKTFTADQDGETDEQEGVSSRFMSTLVDEPEKAKLNVSQANYNVLASTASEGGPSSSKLESEDMEGPSAVLAMAIFDSQKNLLGVLELRNSPLMAAAKDFGEQEEELLMPIVAQAGVTLANLIYSDKLSSTMQDTVFSAEDLELLTKQILESGQKVFGAQATLLALPDPATSSFRAPSLNVTFSDGQQKKVPGSSTTSVVYQSQLASWVEDIRGHPDESALAAEFNVGEICGASPHAGLMLQPIIAAGHSVGVFGTLHTSSIDAREEEQRMITFVGQISILLNNCQMFSKAKLEQEKIKTKIALLDQLKSIGSSMESSEKTAQKIVEWTREVLNCDKGRLFMKDPKKDIMWGTEGGIASQYSLDGATTIQGWVANNRKTARVSDAYADIRFNRSEDVRTQYHTHSVLAVPMQNAKQELTGVIMMVNKREGEFTADDEELLVTIAAQAGVTVSNAQTYDVARKDQNNFNVMLEVSKKLASEMELAALIRNITSSARKLLDCQRGSLFLVSDDRKQLFTKIAEGLEERGKIKEIRLPIDMGIVGACVTGNVVINIPDAYEDRRFDREFDQKSGFRTRSILAVPICSADGTVIGVAQMLNKNGGSFGLNDGVFDVGDENLLRAFGSQAAVSLENSRLFEQAVNSRNFLQNVLRSVKNLVVAFDDKGFVTTCNHSLERYFGATEAQITRSKFASWLSDYPALVNDIEDCMESEMEMEGLPIEVTNSEGETFEMSYTVSPLTYAVKGADAEKVVPEATPRRRADSSERDSRKSEVSAQVRGCVVVFDDMTEKKMMKATLGRYLNPALVSELLSTGANALGGVRQKVTILFSDIRSFTSISERMDAADLVAMLNDYFSYELAPIFDNGGILDKFIGDAIMACFGVPFVSQDDGKTDACMSCKCAMEQLAALEMFNQERRKEKGAESETFAIGIGLNTNKVVSGNIGSDKRMEYTVIGDGVNLASRLEGITKTVRRLYICLLHIHVCAFPDVICSLLPTVRNQGLHV